MAVPLPRAVGAGAARNFALNEVTTLWCTTADDDDFLPEGSLSVRLEDARRPTVWDGVPAGPLTFTRTVRRPPARRT
ncbi:hypothetical protein BM536_004940 [Streptomyces phaeoluteigriseus]|uniref:Glycosyltransferase 2-like domain-containing protein n=1 Tax=Streptomyces phaeoluteigriseus TaxID=114686 RepID=A0A1V6MXZ3_9ACTN|nr:hypothetical protein BM536_004940 [Streptomyces phaeoluteigriseus]